MPSGTLRVTSQDGTTIAYEATGRGPVLVLIDGAMGYRDYRGGRPLAAELAERFSVITYDRRGRGESTDTQPYAVEREIEDLEALIGRAGAPSFLYGFSSGSALALRAAAALGSATVAKLAVLEPPYNAYDQEREAFVQYREQLAALLRQGKRSDAIVFFLKDMLPPDMLEAMKDSPDWAKMESVAATLDYDMHVMGDGSVPTSIAASVHVPALILDGGESPDFKRVAADKLAGALTQARRKTLADQNTLVPAAILAPVLADFFLTS